MARESALHRRARVKLQLRDKHGRWIEMGGGVKWFSSKLGKEVSGTVVGTQGQNALVDMNDDKGHPSKGTPIAIPAHTIEVVDSKATLDLPAAPSADATPQFEKPGIVGKVKNALTGKFDFEGARVSDVSVEDMAKMPKGTVLTSTLHNGSFIKGDGDVWQQKLSNGGNGSLGSSASIKNHDGFSDWVFAKSGTDPKTVKATTKAPESAGIPNPKDDPDHAATMEKYADPDNFLVSKTSDGNTYISVPEGQELYTPAKELAVGDEVIAPDGAHPQKPFSMGKSWATKDAERVNTQGPKIGKVISIKENAYAVVQLPEGETVESTQHPGEMVNTVTIGLSNKVIKATPELKNSLKDVIPEPKYADPEAPSSPDTATPDTATPDASVPDVQAPEHVDAPQADSPAPEEDKSDTKAAIDLANEALQVLKDKIAADDAKNSQDSSNSQDSQDSPSQVSPTTPAQKAPNLLEPNKDEPKKELSDQWDADGSFLKAVEERYHNNPHKAKDTVQQSNNWTNVVKALRGDKQSLKNLLDSKYLDQKMYDDAVQKMDEHDAKMLQKYPRPSGAKPTSKPLTGYDLKPNKRGVFIPTEPVSPSAQMGLFKGDLYPPSLPFMLKDTNSGDTYYWDTNGTRHWGQFGGAGALTRRLNEKGEYEYLLAQRGASMSSSPNMWALPGGAHKYESDAKNPGITAKTELDEELGFKVNGEPVANYKHQTAKDWAYDYSIFDAPAGQEPNWDNVDTKEIQDLKWMTAPEIQKLKDDGQLQENMAEVLPELMKTSESVQNDHSAPETSKPDSNAPEAPSKAADSTPETSAQDQKAPEATTPASQAPETSSEPAAPAQEAPKEPTVELDGPSVTTADGKPAYVGSRVTHATFGSGTVVQIIAGKSAKIEFDDGKVKISQAHKISNFDGKAQVNAAVDTSTMTPGEHGNNPSNGKLFIVGNDNTPIYQGDKVEAMHQGKMQSGVVKGIYKSNKSVAIVFDGESKPSTKKASTAKTLEKQPEASVDAPSTNSTSTESPKFNENGYTPEEQSTVDSLEKQLSEAYQGKGDGNIDHIEGQLDELYAKSDARLKGTPEPEKTSPETTPTEQAPDVQAPQEPQTPEAPKAEEAPEPKVEETPAEAPSEPAKPEAPAEATPEESAPVAAQTPSAASEAPAGSSLDLGNGVSQFVKSEDGNEWELHADGKPTGIKGTHDQIQQIADASSTSISHPVQHNSEDIAPSAPETNNTPEHPVDAGSAEPDIIDDPSKEVITSFKQKFSEKPIGSTAGDLQGDYFKKIGENQWKGYWDGEVSPNAPVTDDVMAELGYQDLDEFHPDNVQVPSDKAAPTPEEPSAPEEIASEEYPEDIAAKKKFDSIDSVEYLKTPNPDDLDSLEPGTQIVNSYMPDDVWMKLSNGTWKASSDGYEASSTSLASGNDVKVIQHGTPAEKTPEAPKNDEPFEPVLPSALKAQKAKQAEEDHAAVTKDVANLPIDSMIGDPKSTQYKKTDSNQWTDYYEGELQGSHSYGDSEIAELVQGVPQFSMDSVVLPEGGKVAEAPKSDGTIDGFSPEDFSKLPEGTKVAYSDSTNFSVPVGTYEKTAGGWSYTPNGATKPTHNDLPSSLFDHLFDDGVSSENYKVVSTGHEAYSTDSTEGLPTGDPNVQKHTKIGGNSSMLDELPVGSTVKPEKYPNYYDSNSIYYVKQADGTWAGYKKTTSKIMSQGSLSSDSVANVIINGVVSKPASDQHFVMGTGEIGYTGDVVQTSDGNKYTVEKILSSGVNVVDANGVKSKKKPQELMKDSEYGNPAAAQGHQGWLPPDPLTQSSQNHEKVLQEQLAAKQKAEKATQDLKKFAGASADEYDAQGVSMPSNPSPKTDSGLTVLETGEPDTSDPLYGTPKPVAPPTASNYPAFQPPEAEPLPKWDSASWLEKVKQRYLDNPNKAKPTLEQSNNWNQVKSAMDGNKAALDDLLSSMYLTPELHQEALDKMAEQDSKNAPLKAKIVQEAKDAKEAYDAKKTIDLAHVTKATDEYKDALAKWLKANPTADSYKKAKLPAVSTKNFEGGPADWEKAHVGTYTAKSVMDSMKKDNVLGTHGLSIATDSDQIEDLDVKVTKVLDNTGAEKLEFKFKLTAPNGVVLNEALSKDTSVSKSDGIYPSHMVKDPATGLFKDSGKPSSGFINGGTRYSWTDQMTGAKIVFQKSTGTGVNVSSNDNTVKIHMPMDSTPELYQQTLENLGIKKAKPSTSGDIKVLAENKLISLMGEHSSTVKTYDGRVNMSGEDRKKALDKIAQDYGVTPEDLIFSTEPNGRVRLSFSDAKAEELAKKYKVDYFRHNVAASHDADTWVNMIAGTNPGLLSTYHRFTEGIGGKGQSSTSDMSNGAGDYVYITPGATLGNNNKPAQHSGVVIKSKSIFKRTDFWANPGDGWGKKAEGGSTSNKAPYKLFDQVGSPAGSVYEVLPKDTVPVSDWAYAVVPNGVAEKVREKLQGMGILEINGLPLDQFILSPGSSASVDLTATGVA